MSGSLRVLTDPLEPEKHDHVDIELESGTCIRFNDPRRFGAFLWLEGDMASHELLSSLGPKPLFDEFTAEHLHRQSRGRKVAVKSFIMNGRVVVGVGNIHVSESLFMAGFHSASSASQITMLSSATRLMGTTPCLLIDGISYSMVPELQP